MEDLGTHPFNYDLNRIGDYVEDLVSIGQQKHALEVISFIKRKYLLGRNNAEINHDRIPFYHLKNHHLSDFAHSINGTRYEDGSTYSVIFELNRLEKWVESFLVRKVKIGTVSFVALYLYYSGANVSSENIDDLARSYGFENGAKLKQEYNKSLISADRTADPESKTKLKNKIKLFEAVRDKLDPLKRRKIEDELKILKGYLSSY